MGAVKKVLGQIFNIPYFAEAFVDGAAVGVGHVLRDGVYLEFVQVFGLKGGGDQSDVEAKGKALVDSYPGLKKIRDQVRAFGLDAKQSIEIMLVLVCEFVEEKFGPVPETATRTVKETAKLLAELPKEVSTEQAAKILGVSKDTVLKLKSQGVLEYRNTAPPGSSRPVFAFTLASVTEVRTAYERDEPLPRRPHEPQRRRARGQKTYKHLNLED